MTWFINEIIRSGNSTARVKSYDPITKFIVLMEINGAIEDGSYITGEDSGSSGILNGFSISDEYEDDQYADKSWDDIEYFVFDDVDIVAIDKHFNGKESQDYQTTYVVRIDGS